MGLVAACVLQTQQQRHPGHHPSQIVFVTRASISMGLVAARVLQTQQQQLLGHHQSEIVCVTRTCISMGRVAVLVQMVLRRKGMALLPLLNAYVQRVLS